MLKWLVELGVFDIKYIPRITIKAQEPKDFISELIDIDEHATLT